MNSLYKSSEYKPQYNKSDDLSRADPSVRKFYQQKYFLFSKYDAGLKIDTVGWFSLTPEPVSAFMAYYVQKYP